MRPSPEPSTPPIAGVRLTPMRERDLARVSAIERDAYPDPWKKEHFLHELLENRFAVSRTLRLEDLVIGYAMAWRLQHEFKINNVAVDRTFRRRGLADWMLGVLLCEARESGCTTATLEVRPSNRPALALYRRHGFREVCRRKGYYQPENEDAIQMTAPL